ncbi:probable 28S ribosomal protein S6, mitochondrial [Folsomia candida]|uniref:Small ribosomal subunit protein bS6m n=1 Tax=Folsomia candida TaxID=158441 RepID=A0A226EM37_FOLCA|nr:probable 28S ribosomal protein S6, mitochondrial [Folsomia candida]OXA57821.1 hypothetical protein Fcan01_08032 [Folsomia candida]
MPSYELSILMRKLGQPETANVLKRAALNIFKNKGVLFGIENLGTRTLPHKIASFGKRYTEGSHFLMRLDLPASSVELLYDEYERDTDILVAGFVREKPIETKDCTLHDELLPPAYREDVKKMIEQGRKKERKFRLNTGLSYNPFNR